MRHHHRKIRKWQSGSEVGACRNRMRRPPTCLLLSLLLLSAPCSAAGATIEGKENAQKFRYELEVGKNEPICVDLAALYNRLLSQAFVDQNRLKSHQAVATNFEAREAAAFAAGGFAEPPTKQFEFPSVDPRRPLDVDFAELYLVDFFREGSPRLVEFVQHLGNGGRTESTQILVLKKAAVYKEVLINESTTGVDPELVEWDLPTKKSRQTTGKVYLRSGEPYIVFNHYSFLPNFEDNKVEAFTLESAGLNRVCGMTLGSGRR
jgi:hypothetical protein